MFALQRRSSKRVKNSHKDNPFGNQFNLELNHYYKYVEFVPRNVSNARAFNTEYIEVITKPFRAYKLKKFFKTSVADAIYKEITNLEFTTKRNDLFTLQQTSDLSSFSEESPLYWLRNFFDYQVRHVLEIIYKKELDGILSISLSKYINTCHLLCHDDMVSNRDIAFICYLNDWDPENGGLLEMYSCDKYGRPSKVENIVNPTFNTLLCFEVCSTSYHQVSEVVTQLPKSRYAISGWFHSTAAEKRHIPKQIKVLESELPVKLPLLFSNSYDVGELLQHVPKYYISVSRQSAQKFEEDGVLLLNSFVKDYLYDEMSVELKGNRINWVREGPPNVRNTETAVLDYTSADGLIPDCPCLSAVIDSMRSSTFLSFIYYILGINFNAVDIRLEVEVNRWSWKTYTLSNSLSNNELFSSIELFLFLNTDNIAANLDEGTSGTLHNFSNFDAFIAPSKNTLVILNRPPGDMSPYMKYVNNQFRDTCFHSIRLRYFAVAVNDD